MYFSIRMCLIVHHFSPNHIIKRTNIINCHKSNNCEKPNKSKDPAIIFPLLAVLNYFLLLYLKPTQFPYTTIPYFHTQKKQSEASGTNPIHRPFWLPRNPSMSPTGKSSQNFLPVWLVLFLNNRNCSAKYSPSWSPLLGVNIYFFLLKSKRVCCNPHLY